MKDVSPDPWDLMEAGQFGRAIERFAELYAREEPERYLSGRALALLLSGDPASALDDFQSLASQKDRRHLSDADLIYPGICHWYLRSPDQAVDCWLRALSAPYTDAAGGVTPAALLVYAGERLQDQAVTKRGLRSLARSQRSWDARQKRRQGQGRPTHSDFVHEGLATWPGVIAPLLLGLAETPDVWRSARAAQHPTLRRRWECQAEFYIAIRSLAKGERAGFREGMTRCAAVAEGRLEFEYYLALWEVQQGFPEPAFA